MWRISFLICLLVLCGAMGAASKTNTGTFESPKELPDTIVVTANRFGLSPAQSVWPVTIVPLKKTSTPISLDKAIEGKAGVDVRSYNGYGSVATLSNWGVFNRHMLLLYNGRVVKDYSLGGFTLSDFSIDEFERVEILKGPQSAFYGSDAVGGVINLISKSSLVDKINLNTTIGNLGYQRYNLDFSKKLTRFGIGAFVEHGTSDNRRDNAGVNRDIITIRTDYLSPDGKHRFSFSSRYFNDSLGVPGPVPDPLFIPVYGSEESSSLTAHQEDENYSLDAQYHFHDETIGTWQVDMFWEKKNLDYRSLYNYQYWYNTIDTTQNPPDTIANADSVDVHANSYYRKRSSGISTRYMKSLSNINIAGGIDWLSGSLHAATNDTSFATTVIGPFAPYSYDYTSTSAWVGKQNQFDTWANINLTQGDNIRFDLSGRLQFVKNRTTQPSYNIGLLYTPKHYVRIKLGYAYAFRLPTIAEQFADDLFTAGNANLNPETARTLQGTLETVSQNKRYQARVTVFHQQIDSLIQYRYNPAIFRSVPVNVEQFKSTGVDISLQAQVTNIFSVQWAGVVQKAEQTVDNRNTLVDAYYVPDFKWRADFNASYSSFSGNLNLTYTSDRYIMLFGGSRKEIRNVYELGFQAGVQINKHIRLGLSGYDLTDERRPDQFGFTISDGNYPTVGRRIVVDVQMSIL